MNSSTGIERQLHVFVIKNYDSEAEYDDMFQRYNTKYHQQSTGLALQSLGRRAWVRGWDGEPGYEAGTESLGTRLGRRAWVRGWDGEPGYEAGTESLGTRLGRRAWVRGWDGEPGYEAGTESLGTRLGRRAWVRGWDGQPGYEAGTDSLGTRLGRRAWVRGWDGEPGYEGTAGYFTYLHRGSCVDSRRCADACCGTER